MIIADHSDMRRSSASDYTTHRGERRTGRPVAKRSAGTLGLLNEPFFDISAHNQAQASRTANTAIIQAYSAHNDYKFDPYCPLRSNGTVKCNRRSQQLNPPVVLQQLALRPARLGCTNMNPRTMYKKIWDAHVVRQEPGEPALIYIDRHLIHEVTSPQAFAGLKAAGRKVRRPD